MTGRAWKNAAKLRAKLHEGLLRVPPDVACTCELGAPGISDGGLHGPSCAIVVAAMLRDALATRERVEEILEREELPEPTDAELDAFRDALAKKMGLL